MKTTRLILLAFSLLAIFAFSSCNKGCDDPDAIEGANFDSGNDVCMYEGKVVFWFDEAVSTALQTNSIDLLTLVVDGQIVASSETSNFWIAAPECDQEGAITVTKSLGQEKMESFTYSVRDQTDFKYWEGTIEFEANTCIAVQLTQ